MARPSVLLLTHSADTFTIDRVAAAVSKRGGRPLRIDTDEYPLQTSISVHFGRGGTRVELAAMGRRLRLDQVHAIWVRRLWPSPPPSDLEPRWANACHQMSYTALNDALPLCRSVRFVNPIPEADRAESKLLQLQLAAEVGLQTPATLITNSPGDVRAFGRTHKTIITKLLRPLVQSMRAHRDFHYTQVLSQRDFEALDALHYAPQVFQPFVEKRKELRVIYVAGRALVGGIDTRGDERAYVDWRVGPTGGGLAWTREALPAAVLARVRRFMRKLGLVYGALDFIITPRGEYVFLEVNPSGEWGWLEQELELDISGALADALIGRRR